MLSQKLLKPLGILPKGVSLCISPPYSGNLKALQLTELKGFLKMADRVGFEPTVRSHAHTLSKRAHSTTLTPVRLKNCPLGRGGRKLPR